ASLRAALLLKTGLASQQAAIAVQPVRLDAHTLFNPYINYTYYLSLALLPMSLQLIVMISTIYVLGKMLKDRRGAFLYRLSGGNVWNAYWGKILPYTALFSVIVVYMLNYMFFELEIPLNGNYFVVLAITIMLVLVYQLMALFFVTISKDFRTLATIAGGYSALSFSFVGYTFPSEGMPKWVQIMDYIFPFTSYSRMYIDVAMRGDPLKYSLLLLIGLGVFAAIGLLSLPKFGRILQKGGYHVQSFD
ncbi:MAG TPA: ABC transporter permease, partial [Arachidicoccus sp.]